MQLAGIALAVGIADVVDDDIAEIVDSLMDVSEFAFFFTLIGLLLIVFARIDRVREDRMSPVDRMIALRNQGRRAWR